MNSMFSSKLLVSTGPRYKDVACTENVDIEVDLIPPGKLYRTSISTLALTNPGSCATPPSDVLRNNQAMLSLNLDGKITNIKGLNIVYLVKTTVHLCNDQDLLWDPKKDLLWLCRNYGKEIQLIRAQLDARQVQENFLGTPYFFTLSADEQRLCYHVLMGKDPPPGLFLIPAPQLQSASTRPSIQGSKSAPSLKNTIQQQQQSGFLRPPVPHKTKTTLATPPQGPGMQKSPLPPQQDEGLEAALDSRSRYRYSSAPTTPSGGRNANSEVRAKETSTTFISDSTQKDSGIYQAQTISIQNLSPASKPQVIQTKKSLPRLARQPATTTQAVPVFAHKASSTHMAPAKHIQSIPVVVSTKVETQPQPQDPVLRAHDNNSVSQSAPNAQPHKVAHTHPARKIVVQRHSMIPKTSNIIASEPATFSMEIKKSESPFKGLTVVGPEGLYPKPHNTETQGTKSPSVAPSIHTTTSNFTFELDATSSQTETFSSVATTTEFVAELPANEDATLPPIPPIVERSNSLPETPISPPQLQAHFTSASGYRDSPVSPPTTYRPLDLLVQPLNIEAPIEAINMKPNISVSTSNPSSSPPSFDALPPSLMIGFRGPQHQSHANIESRSRTSSQSRAGSNKPAILNKYQRYYSPPLSRETSPNSGSTSAPTSRQPSPNRGPVYKAYTPPITPPLHPKTEADASTLQQSPLARHETLTPPAATPNATLATSHSPPIRMERASIFVGRVSPPAALRPGAPQALQSIKTPLPNPLASNPPTPRTASHTKHDSHQGNEFGSEACGNHTYSSNGTVQRYQPQPPMAYPNPYQKHTTPTTQQTQYIAFSAKKVSQSPPPRQSSLHQRSVSVESNTSTTSHDSEKLAQEYQLGLPSFDKGYGTGDSGYRTAGTDIDVQTKKSYRPSYAGTGYDF